MELGVKPAILPSLAMAEEEQESLPKRSQHSPTATPEGYIELAALHSERAAGWGEERPP